MILLGRVYGGLMVDVQATNDKLMRRSEDMVMRLAGGTREEARDALGRARGSVKLAVLLSRGCDLATRDGPARSRGRSVAQGAGADRAARSPRRLNLRQIGFSIRSSGMLQALRLSSDESTCSCGAVRCSPACNANAVIIPAINTMTRRRCR